MSEKIILDTDIGSDIDDAVCLAYLLKQKECELLGVTTVSGKRPQVRASLADAVCRAAGRKDIPIHSGSSHGINLDVVQPTYAQEAVLPRFEHRPPEEFRPNTAVNFLREMIHDNPGKITLLAIGPMTNLGLLFTLDPETPKLLKRLVLMCGVFKNDVGCVKEWNAICDPIASSIVYRAPVAGGHLSIGLDVTTKCKLPSEQCVARFKEIGGPLAVVSAMTEVWSKSGHQVTFHDPLASAVIFKPEICQYADGRIDVELKSDRVAGLTHWDPRSEQKPHRIATSVDPEAFFEHYFKTVKG